MKSAFFFLFFWTINTFTLFDSLEKAEEQYWPFLDSSIGFQKSKKKNDLVAWKFNLLELLPNRGKNIRIVIFDGEKIRSRRDKININGIGLYINNKRRTENWLQLHCKDRDRSCFFTRINPIFSDRAKNHLTFTISTIRAFANKAEFINAPIFDRNGKSYSEELLKAIKNQASPKNQILLFGLKVKNSKLKKKIKRELKRFNWTVSAAGNNDSHNESFLPSCTDFSIGAFEKDRVISTFSQHRKGAWPTFVAPAESNSCFRGTSASAAIFSGFLASMLSEFSDQFSKEQLTFIIKASSFKPNNSSEWKDKVKYGAVDMRVAALSTHILRSLQKIMKPGAFQKKFKKIAIFSIDFSRTSLNKIAIKNLEDALSKGVNKIARQAGLTKSFFKG